MNHDICHCKGEGCELRELCKRYKAHQDAKEKNMNNLAYMEPQRGGRDCDSFFRYHEE